jgi:hypothetical protein
LYSMLPRFHTKPNFNSHHNPWTLRRHHAEDDTTLFAQLLL